MDSSKLTYFGWDSILASINSDSLSTDCSALPHASSFENDVTCDNNESSAMQTEQALVCDWVDEGTACESRCASPLLDLDTLPSIDTFIMDMQATPAASVEDFDWILADEIIRALDAPQQTYCMQVEAEHAAEPPASSRRPPADKGSFVDKPVAELFPQVERPIVACNNKRGLDARWPEEILSAPIAEFNHFLRTHRFGKTDEREIRAARRRHKSRGYSETFRVKKRAATPSCTSLRGDMAGLVEKLSEADRAELFKAVQGREAAW